MTIHLVPTLAVRSKFTTVLSFHCGELKTIKMCNKNVIHTQTCTLSHTQSILVTLIPTPSCVSLQSLLTPLTENATSLSAVGTDSTNILWDSSPFGAKSQVLSVDYEQALLLLISFLAPLGSCLLILHAYLGNIISLLRSLMGLKTR